MTIVSAGVHAMLVGRPVRHLARLIHWECIHIGPNSYGGAIDVAAEEPDHSRARHSFLHIQTNLAKSFRDISRRLPLLIAPFRDPMQRSASLDDLRAQCLNTLLDLFCVQFLHFPYSRFNTQQSSILAQSMSEDTA
jgi:hypothetical protein